MTKTNTRKELEAFVETLTATSPELEVKFTAGDVVNMLANSLDVYVHESEDLYAAVQAAVTPALLKKLSKLIKEKVLEEISEGLLEQEISEIVPAAARKAIYKLAE